MLRKNIFAQRLDRRTFKSPNCIVTADWVALRRSAALLHSYAVIVSSGMSSCRLVVNLIWADAVGETRYGSNETGRSLHQLRHLWALAF